MYVYVDVSREMNVNKVNKKVFINKLITKIYIILFLKSENLYKSTAISTDFFL